MNRRFKIQEDLERAISEGKSQKTIDNLRIKIADLEAAEKRLLATREKNAKNLKEIEAEANSFSNLFTQIAGKLNALTIPLTALAGLGVAAWGQQEKAIVSMNTALEAGGFDVETYGKKFEKIASDIQKFTTFGDEVILQNEQLALSFGVPADKMEEVQRGAVALASAYGKALPEATKILSRAMVGDFEALNEVIPAIKMTSDKTEKLAILNEKLAGAWEVAKKQAETTTGALQQTKNALGDAAEQIGKVLAPMVISAANAVKTLAEWFSSLSDTSKALLVSIGASAVALPKIIKAYQTLSATMVALGTSTKGAAVAMKGLKTALVSTGVGAAVVALGWGLEKLISYFDSTDEELKETAESAEKFKGVTVDLEKAIAKTAESTNALEVSLKNLKAIEDERRVSKLDEISKQVHFSNVIEVSKERIEELTEKSNDLALSEEERAKIIDEIAELTREQYRAEDELAKIQDARRKKEQDAAKKEQDEAKKLAEDAKKKIESERKSAEEKAKQIAQARAEFEIQLKIQKLEKNDKQAQADAIKNALERNRLMKELGYSIDEATQKIKELRDLEKQDEGKGKVSYSEKDVEKAKKLLERGEGGSVGKKTLEQAQAIVEGRQIEGGELAIFSGAQKRAKTKNSRDLKFANLGAAGGIASEALGGQASKAASSPRASAAKQSGSQSDILSQILAKINEIPATIKEVFA